MKACIVGAGAIGGILAVRLIKAGWNVSVVARGAHLQAIRQRGLRLETETASLQTWPKASDSAAEIGPQDIVIVTTKTTSLKQAAAMIPALTAPQTPVVFVSNGLPWWVLLSISDDLQEWSPAIRETLTAIGSVVDEARCIAGVAFAASHIKEPGLIVNTNSTSSRFVFGSHNPANQGPVQELVTCLNQGGVETVHSENISQFIWKKVAQNAVTAPLGALTGMTSGVLLNHPGMRGIPDQILSEVNEIAASCGVEPCLIDLSVIAKRLINHKSSMLQDFESGRRPEVDMLLGALVDIANIKLIPAPNLRLITRLVEAKAEAMNVKRE